MADFYYQSDVTSGRRRPLRELPRPETRPLEGQQIRPWDDPQAPSEGEIGPLRLKPRSPLRCAGQRLRRRSGGWLPRFLRKGLSGDLKTLAHANDSKSGAAGLWILHSLPLPLHHSSYISILSYIPSRETKPSVRPLVLTGGLTHSKEVPCRRFQPLTKW
jgi:hypothetical protein